MIKVSWGFLILIAYFVLCLDLHIQFEQCTKQPLAISPGGYTSWLLGALQTFVGIFVEPTVHVCRGFVS